MLINLSNHSSTNWSDEQKKEALRLFGGLTNMVFPLIDPNLDTNAIEKLADEYLRQIRLFQLNLTDSLIPYLFHNEQNDKVSHQTESPLVVHLMGELTFCFALASRLQQYDIRCVVSTTERIADEQNGLKLSQFNFVKFRDYPSCLPYID